MRQSFGSSPALFASGLGILVMNPPPVLASDFGPMALGILLIFAAIGGVALLLGVTTAAVLVRVYRRKALWFLTPVFAVGWAALTFGVFQLYINRHALLGGPGPEPVPVPAIPYLVPVGVETAVSGEPPIPGQTVPEPEPAESGAEGSTPEKAGPH